MTSKLRKWVFSIVSSRVHVRAIEATPCKWKEGHYRVGTGSKLVKEGDTYDSEEEALRAARELLAGRLVAAEQECDMRRSHLSLFDAGEYSVKCDKT